MDDDLTRRLEAVEAKLDQLLAALARWEPLAAKLTRGPTGALAAFTRRG
jgi:hypothetical protein